jgi:hypothetical protein
MIRAAASPPTPPRPPRARPPRCADGVDNDDDGRIDLADVGCSGARDNESDDPMPAPLCGNGQDDDGDDAADWPDDPSSGWPAPA